MNRRFFDLFQFVRSQHRRQIVDCLFHVLSLPRVLAPLSHVARGRSSSLGPRRSVLDDLVEARPALFGVLFLEVVENLLSLAVGLDVAATLFGFVCVG